MTESQDPLQPSGQDLDRELEQLLAEAEETVVRVRRVLESRRDHAVQHAEIDRLEEHMARTQVRWAEVRHFFQTAFRELVGRDTDVSGNAEGEQNRA